MKMKKRGKQQFVYANQSAVAVDSLPTPPPNYYTSKESAYEMEKEVIKEAKEEAKDIKHEDEQSLITPQENSCDDTEM